MGRCAGSNSFLTRNRVKVQEFNPYLEVLAHMKRLMSSSGIEFEGWDLDVDQLTTFHYITDQPVLEIFMLKNDLLDCANVLLEVIKHEILLVFICDTYSTSIYICEGS